jgi:uncharacterized protein
MPAVFFNVAAIILGSLLGLLARARSGKAAASPGQGGAAGAPAKDYRSMVMAAAGIFTLFIGVKMAFQSKREIYVILSIAGGGLLGSWLGIEAGILRLGEAIKTRLPGKAAGHTFAEGFLSSSVLFCVGAMAILGSFKAGIEGDYKLIYIKSILDGFLSVILAARFGLGVMFSAIPVLLYQGGLTLLSRWIQPVLPELAISEISGAGGAMVMMIGINLLEIKKIRTGDFLPALVLVVGFCLLDPWLGPYVTF